MTDLFAETKIPSKVQVQNTLLLVDKLTTTALNCQTNFTWLHHNEARAILLLDFDIIRGAMPTMALNELSNDLVKRRQPEGRGDKGQKKPENMFFLNDLMGPHTLNYLLNSPNLDFTLPPGTIYEMCNSRNGLRIELKDQAGNFFSTFERAKNNPSNWKQALKNHIPYNAVIESLWEDVVGFANKLEYLRIIESLEKRSKSPDLFFNEEFEAKSEKAFDSVSRSLKERRSAFKINNNLADATNVACTVQLFNNPVRAELWNNKRPVPFLISQSHWIGASDIIQPERWLSFPETDLPVQIFCASFYFMISQSLLRQDAGRYNIAAIDAGILARHAGHLANSYRAMLNAYQVMHNTPPSSAAEIDLSNSAMRRHWYQVQQMSNEFRDRWLPVIAPVFTQNQHDRLGYLNALSSSETRAFLEANRHSPHMLQNLQSFLRNFTLSKSDMWQLLCQYERQPLEVDSKTTDVIELLYSFRILENNGSVLSHISRDVGNLSLRDRLTSLGEGWICKDHDIRIAVHMKHGLSNTLFAVESWLDTDQSDIMHFSVVWLHTAEVTEIWRIGLHLLNEGAKVIGHSLPFSYSIFASNGENRGQGDLNTCEKVIKEEFLARDLEIHYVQIRTGNLVFYADALPIADTELQAGFVLPNELFEDKVTQLVSQTLTQMSTMPADYKGVLSFVSKLLKEQLTEMTQTSQEETLKGKPLVKHINRSSRR